MTPLRIANCSGFFGDRISAAREMVDGGPIDVLTGDWLAELTMGVLLKQQRRSPASGYASTFLTQLEDVLADCLARGIKVVSNAGGLNPEGCAEAVRELAARLGLKVRVAVVSGDNATAAFRQAQLQGWPAPHLDTGAPFSDLGVEPDVASAYLGCWGIAEALAAGADVVITGRVVDAALVVGPAAWRFGWQRDDWDQLAGAVAAGHVIECGAQATGGNFSFFQQVPGLERAGFPLAEIHADGSSVITKHPGTGGAVTVETVTAQLLYEIDGPAYLTPDVVARFDDLELVQAGPDRVAISGARGQPAPDTIKVGALCHAGFRSSTTFVLTGLDVQAKADLAQRALWAAVPGGLGVFRETRARLIRADRADPASMEQAVALLTVSVAAAEAAPVARFGRAAVATALASYPGLHLTAPPAPASSYTVFWPTLMPAQAFSQQVSFEGRRWTVSGPSQRQASPRVEVSPRPAPADEPTVRVPLGTLVGSRSGDKAGNATLGLWAQDDTTHTWLRSWWDEEQVRRLVPEAAVCAVRLWEISSLRAVGCTIVGLLGLGVAASLDLDSQAKGLGEYVRARLVDVPARLVRV
ncbi:MAG: exopolyphosphatase [Frankiales bacterium]|jgi:hypothetical protein|nr:exopolyphosphatase [Frankiales bacterium]